MLTKEEKKLQAKLKTEHAMQKPISRRALRETLGKVQGWEFLTQKEKQNILDTVLATPEPRKYLAGATKYAMAWYILQAIEWAHTKQHKSYWLSVYCKVRDGLIKQARKTEELLVDKDVI